MEAAGKTIELLPARDPAAPLVVLNGDGDGGRLVYEAARALTSADFSLAAVGGLAWDRDLSPWPCPPVMKGGEAFSGGAPGYLASLTEQLVPAVLEALGGTPAYLALAGYSLAGLFAVWAAFQTPLFTRIASASGSLWYPDFLGYIEAMANVPQPSCVYLSLGDREAKTGNPVLRTVEENTRALERTLSARGIRTTFETNPGNHFRNAPERMARGIAWILEQE